MGHIAPFDVEEWMDEYETKAKYNIAETCCASISIDDLNDLSGSKSGSTLSTATKLTYGHIRGNPTLRENLANLYSTKSATPLPPSQILITPGAIAANHLVLYTLLKEGDHVVVHHPTYQQLYSIPASLGATVSLWRAKPEKNWIPDIEELKALIKPETKLIVVNNPNNPTGAILPRPLLEEIIALAKEHDLTILSDEVYRPIFHSVSPIDPTFPPSMLNLDYEKTIATGSMSKAFSLAGIRIGWMASRSAAIIEALAKVRHYTTISVSALDEAVASFALGPDAVHALLARNIALAKTNLEILDRFVIKHDEYVHWVRPVAGTTAFLRFHRDGVPVDDYLLCQRLVKEIGVLFVPGTKCFGIEEGGWVRVGYVCETEVLKEGLEAVRKWMRKEFDDMPLLA